MNYKYDLMSCCKWMAILEPYHHTGYQVCIYLLPHQKMRWCRGSHTKGWWDLCSKLGVCMCWICIAKDWPLGRASFSMIQNSPNCRFGNPQLPTRIIIIIIIIVKKKYSVRWINKGMFLLFVCADLMFYLSLCAISVVNIFAVWGCLSNRKLGFLFTLLGSQFSFRSKYKKWPF